MFCEAAEIPCPKRFLPDEQNSLQMTKRTTTPHAQIRKAFALGLALRLHPYVRLPNSVQGNFSAMKKRSFTRGLFEDKCALRHSSGQETHVQG
jgi:hypothetical protein